MIGRTSFVCVVFLFAISTVGSAAKLPSHIKKCDRKLGTDEFNKCIVDACLDILPKLAKAIPEMGLPALEPLEVPVLNIGAGSGPVAVQQNFKDVKIYGIPEITDVRAVTFDFDKKVLNIEATAPQLKFLADYDLNGKVLLLPIQGQGPSVIVLDNLKVSINLPYEEFQKKGHTHFKFSNTVLKFDPGHVSFQFDNLFNGDKALGDNINKVLNENWKEVFADIKKGYEDAFAIIVQGLTNDVFTRIPIQEIFLN